MRMSATPERVQEALDGLWKKFEEQERELDMALKRISALNRDLAKIGSIESALRSQRDQRDVEVERFRMRIFDLERKKESRRDEMELTERYLVEDRMAMEAALESVASLRMDLLEALEELRVRDYWYDANKGLLTHVLDVIKTRQMAIDGARQGPVEFEVMGPGMEQLLSDAHVTGDARSKILEHVQEAPSELIRLSEKVLSQRFGLGMTEAMLLRRALDRHAFSPVPAGATVFDPEPVGKELKFAVWQNPDLKMTGINVDPTISCDSEEDIIGLSRAFYPAFCDIMDKHVSTVDKVTVLVHRKAETGGGNIAVDNREMLSDDNFLLAVWRGMSRGISLVPGLTNRAEDINVASDLTREPLYKGIVSRLDLDPQTLVTSSKDMGFGVKTDDGSLGVNPLTGLVLSAAVSYLLQKKELHFTVLEAVLEPSVDGANVLRTL